MKHSKPAKSRLRIIVSQSKPRYGNYYFAVTESFKTKNPPNLYFLQIVLPLPNSSPIFLENHYGHCLSQLSLHSQYKSIPNMHTTYMYQLVCISSVPFTCISKDCFQIPSQINHPSEFIVRLIKLDNWFKVKEIVDIWPHQNCLDKREVQKRSEFHQRHHREVMHVILLRTRAWN